MNMKRTIFNLLQTGIRSMALCTLTFGLSAVANAQTEDDEELEEVETAIKQPTRSQMKQVNYPTVKLKGMVTDLATGKPLTGIQLQALEMPRYTAMTEDS